MYAYNEEFSMVVIDTKIVLLNIYHKISQTNLSSFQ
jgi:hypothetical protein